MGKDRSYTTALHILAALAFYPGGLLSSEDLAKSLKTNPGLVRRILLKLSKKGLITSFKGKGGGSRLARTATDITLDEVYLAVKEGPLFRSFDKEPFKACKVSCNIGGILNGVYSDLEVRLIEEMKKVKLQKILSEIN